MKIPGWAVRVAIVVALCGGVGCALGAGLASFPTQGRVVQRLAVFDNPEGAIFSADGRHVFISNSAELGMPAKGFHWVHGGYISKLEVQSDGTLKMVNERLISGLTGPPGMAVSTVATGKFPQGTEFVVESWSQLAGCQQERCSGSRGQCTGLRSGW